MIPSHKDKPTPAHSDAEARISKRNREQAEKEVGEVLERTNSSVLKTLIINQNEFKKFLSRRLPNEQVAEDLLQNSLARAIENQLLLKQEDSVFAWFYRILRNALVDYYRSHAHESKKCQEFLQELLSSSEDQKSAPDEIRTEVCACMERLLPALKPPYAEILKRVDLESQSPNVIAQELGLTLNNLNVRLHRARQALKLSLQRSCGICSEHGCLDCTCEEE